MLTYLSSKHNPSSKERAQAIVEFAIVLPILLMILVGLLEVGRMIFQYAAITNASREAARYASAVGLADGTSYNKYQYCAGIKDVAKRAAFTSNLSDSDIAITYDHGTGGSTFDTCDGSVDTGVSINTGTNFDRATVTITTVYRPMVNLVPIPQRTITSTSSRTILGILQLDTTVSSGGGAPGGGPGGSGTSTPTSTATSTTTPTETATPRNPSKTPKFVATFTPVNTDTPAPPTNTPTATATATFTSTPTSTGTATDTPTPLTCASITAGSIFVSNKTMTTTVSNPMSDPLTISGIVVKWNSASGASGGKTLTLNKADYGATNLWSGTNSTGTQAIPISPAVTVAAGKFSSTFAFTFDKNYDFPTGQTSIQFSLSSPSCGTFSITTSK